MDKDQKEMYKTLFYAVGANLLVGATTLCVLGALLFLILDIKQPGIFPLITALVLILFGGIILVVGNKKLKKAIENDFALIKED